MPTVDKSPTTYNYPHFSFPPQQELSPNFPLEKMGCLLSTSGDARWKQAWWKELSLSRRVLEGPDFMGGRPQGNDTRILYYLSIPIKFVKYFSLKSPLLSKYGLK